MGSLFLMSVATAAVTQRMDAAPWSREEPFAHSSSYGDTAGASAPEPAAHELRLKQQQQPPQLPQWTALLPASLPESGSVSLAPKLLASELAGGDRDEHGCIPSAGYSWCQPLAQCIRAWETNCTTPTSSESYAASDDDAGSPGAAVDASTYVMRRYDGIFSRFSGPIHNLGHLKAYSKT